MNHNHKLIVNEYLGFTYLRIEINLIVLLDATFSNLSFLFYSLIEINLLNVTVLFNKKHLKN